MNDLTMNYERIPAAKIQLNAKLKHEKSIVTIKCDNAFLLNELIQNNLNGKRS